MQTHNTLYTIGHSNHSLEKSLELLRMHEQALSPDNRQQFS